jgi:hypothetical protein
MITQLKGKVQIISISGKQAETKIVPVFSVSSTVLL